MANPFLLETIRGTAATKQVQLASLIATLTRSVDILTADIEDAEAAARVHDVSDQNYSVLARSLRTRRDNLRVTIGAREGLVQGTPKAAALGDGVQRSRSR
jgi:hypothetical protein